MAATRRSANCLQQLRSYGIDVKQLVLNTKVNVPSKEATVKPSKVPVTLSKPIPKATTSISMQLFEEYNPGIVLPKAADMSLISRFFNSSKVKFEWCAREYLEIPGERYKIEQAQLQQQELLDEKSFNESLDIREPTEAYRVSADIKNRPIPNTEQLTRGSFLLHDELPEIIFLGRSNAGKSTLLNNLTTNFKQVQLNRHATTSKKAGHTRALYCYNVGNRLRLVDSPGYGVMSTQQQGECTMQYIRERKQLRRCFMLISAKDGFTKTDYGMLEFLMNYGIAFEVIFTKMDKVRDVKTLRDSISTSGILDAPIRPRLMFLNSVVNKAYPKRLGIAHLRQTIFEACNIKPNTLPSKAYKQ
ncbi:AEL095Cp [Eremothecium gossypii ATCC 10895]|uniref:AEL095Cp n=1 Tax=Eremothecium gossypii (strain ATCC 10895 / CBS 109.51 / FGSC 9923 / NRRL Y-1056) TaxID=284811 RepID=Q757V7_EREGS|nr:AEL095Cp [Eremothecium gossypii ATCC 10895]AAS52590.1 AEL095Cp [Eremothecium gossypii ATCC 10895]AEY96892.1 FAEL095Cp [Eremothecium gossypii FDAG1]